GSKGVVRSSERLGEPPEDPLLLFDVLYGFWYANLGAFNGDVVCDLAAQYLALAEKQRATIPLMVGHRVVGSSSLHAGDFVDSRAHYDQALSLYDADKHHSLATRFGQDIRVSILSFRSITLWILGYPEAALTDVDQVVKGARAIGHAASLIYALAVTSVSHLLVGNYASVNAQTDEAVAMAEEIGEVFWKEMGATVQGYVVGCARAPRDCYERDRSMSKFQDAMRRVITGDNAEGQSVIIIDGGSSSEIGSPDLGGLFEIWEDSGVGALTPSAHEDLGTTRPVLGPRKDNFQVRWFVISPLPEGVPKPVLDAAVRERF